MSLVQKNDEMCQMWQMEVMMEKLRNKASSLRPMQESAKMVKQAILNKQHLMDQKESTSLGKCLDTLQQNIKVTSLPAMIERLGGIARQLGLQFTRGTAGAEVYISCDMFYVEVLMQSDGQVSNVKIELAGDQIEAKGQVSSPELAECLGKGDFGEFTAHLEGFLSIYQLNTEKKYKCKAYQALQALEVDLMKLYEIAQETLNDTHRLITKSPVGLLMRRRGGFPMKMVYFISPYELLDVASGRSVSLTYESASTKDLSYTVSVNIEASTTHKLQSVPLVNVQLGADGLTLPSIMALTPANSISLPACFSLKLKTPMAMSLSLARKISEITQIQCYDPNAQQPLIPLIIQQASCSTLDINNNKGLFVTLPDQQHCYFMTNGTDLEGVIVEQIPFTHPTSIAPALENLRVQAVFNALITSCVRPDSKQEIDSSYVFEVTAMSHEFISVTFEHPEEESTATAELDLTDFSNVKCHMYTLGVDAALCSDEYATKVLQRCLSIPITMRAVLRKATKEEKKDIPPAGEPVSLLGGNSLPNIDSNQNTKFLLNDYNPISGRNQIPSQMTVNNVTVAQGSPRKFSPVVKNEPNQFVNTVQEYPLVSTLGQKTPFPQHFLGDTKLTKVKKKEKKPLKSDVKDVKLDKSFTKRRLSTEVLTDTSSNDLAALREKVYGPASAGNYAKLGWHSKDSKKSKKGKGENDRKSPIILDLTESERPASGNFNTNLLKRSGIEIIPISGTNTPISIPSSITVTPVRNDKDRKKEKKDLDKRDKKRRRDDSPSSGRSSKVQIITTSKPGNSSPIDKSKNDGKLSMSGSKTVFHTPPKKPSLSPSLSKSIMLGKVSFSPTHKPNKPVYSPHSSPKGTGSPKHCSSPKHPNMSPKHSSMGKPSMNALKSNSPSFSKPNLSPKLKTKERSSSNSPSRLSPAPPNAQSNKKPTPEKQKTNTDALTITKVPDAANLSPSHSDGSSPSGDKISLDKAKASPPKNRKGSSLSDIVDKLRAGACGSGNALTIVERKNTDKKITQEQKKDGDNFTIKSGTGFKFIINKARSKEGKSGSSSSVSPNSKQNVNRSNSIPKSTGISVPTKKVSMSSFPPIPKLPRSSVSSVTSTAISPLNNSVTMAHCTPLQYQRERPKETRPVPEKSKPKELKSSPPIDTKKDSMEKKPIKDISETIDDVDRALNSMFGGELHDRTEIREILKADDSKSSKNKLDLPRNSEAVRNMLPPAIPSGQSKIHEKENISNPEDKKNPTSQSPTTHNTSITKKPMSPSAGSYPPSPTLSIKIVKSPAPVTSPLNMISPQAVSLQHSPCIIDDELMDEALISSRK